MMFNVIRIILFVILSGLSVFIRKKYSFVKRGVITVLTVVFSLMLICVISLFPFENFFMNFDAAEDVFIYSRCGMITEIIHGDESCMIIYSKGNDTFDHYIIPKTDKGYIIPGFSSVKTVSKRFDKNGLLNVYNVRGTDDYYVFGAVNLDNRKNGVKVFQDEDEEIETEIYNVSNSGFIYFYIKNFTPSFHLVINEQKVMLYQ